MPSGFKEIKVIFLTLGPSVYVLTLKRMANFKEKNAIFNERAVLLSIVHHVDAPDISIVEPCVVLAEPPRRAERLAVQLAGHSVTEGRDLVYWMIRIL